MRQLLFTGCIAIISFSCGQSDKKEKDPATKDTAAITPPDTADKKSVAETAPADTAKTIKLTFAGYEEGDYAHLMFTETGTNTDYDFGHPEDNSLNNIQVVLKEQNSAFGYKENSKMKGAKFVADIIYKTTDTYDANGQPTIGKEWRIASLKKDE
jgi:hypothetical protein